MLAGRTWWQRLQRQREGGGGTRLRFLALAVVCVTLIVMLISGNGALRMADARAFDFLSTVLLPEMEAASPVIVAIDEPSFAEVGRQWPWPRDLHARLVAALRRAGARAIGIDIIFAEASIPEADAALAAAMGPDVVLAADETLIQSPQADQMVRVEPLPDLTAAGARSGLASVSIDGDGTLRRVPAYDDGFALRLLEAAGIDARRRPGAMLQVFGLARSFPTASYYQALEPERFLPEGFFRDRVVILGLSLQSAADIGAGGTDAFATSWTVRSGRLISGAEVQATIYENLARGLTIAPAGMMARIGCVLAAAVAAALMVRRGTGWRTGVWASALILFILAASFLMLQYGRVYVSPISPVIAFAGVIGIQSARDYAAERRMRRGITRAFSQYLSPVLVERLASDPSLLRLGGETRELTILFCDVRGFTAIAESMKDDPEGLTTLVNRLLSPLSAVIMEAGGTIDKYIGDCIMAFWNAPLEDADHAVHAIEAANAMLVALDRLNEELDAEARASGSDAVALKIGIGINTGLCVVGNMGSETRFDYSALGDAVNLASRLESETKALGVPLLIGPQTVARLGARFALADLGDVHVKGKAVAVRVSTLASLAPPVRDIGVDL